MESFLFVEQSGLKQSKFRRCLRNVKNIDRIFKNSNCFIIHIKTVSDVSQNSLRFQFFQMVRV